MFDEEAVQKALSELGRLNENLEKLHGDMAEVRALHADARHLGGLLRDTGEKLKSLPAIAKHLSIFVQIMLQTRQKAGTVGMIQALIDGLLRSGRKSG